MLYLSRKYNVYSLGDGLYLLSTSMRKAALFKTGRREHEQKAKTPRRRCRLLHKVYQYLPLLLSTSKIIEVLMSARLSKIKGC